MHVIKFLLFREDNPKHSVWQDFDAVDYAIVMPFGTILLAAFVFAGYVYFGTVGFFAAYITSSVLAIEIPHCIFDR